MSTNSPMPGTPQTPTKAGVAFVMAAITALLTALTVGTPDRPLEWIVMVGGVLLTAYTTYAVPNKATTGPASRR